MLSDPATGLKIVPVAAPQLEPTPDSPPATNIHKPMQQPELRPKEEQRQRQIVERAANGLTLALPVFPCIAFAYLLRTMTTSSSSRLIDFMQLIKSG